MTHDTTEATKKVNYKLLQRLQGFLKPYYGYIVAALVITIATSALGPLRPYLTRYAIDNFIGKGDVPGLLQYAGLIVGVLLLQGLMQYALSLLMTWVGQRVLLNIRNTLYAHVQKLALRFYDTTPVGRIVTRVTSDVEQLNELFSSGVILMLSDIMVIIWIVIFMWQTSPQLTLLSITVLPFLLIASFIFRAKVRTVYDLIRTQVSKMNSFINEFITGIGIVQLFRQEDIMSDKFAEINKEHRQFQDRSIFYYATFYPVVELLSAVALTIIIWYAAGHIATAEMTVGMLVAFAQFTEMFFRPIRDLTEKYNTLQSSAVASERIFQLLDNNQTVEDSGDAVPFKGLEHAIEFKNLHFSYDGKTPILKGISFSVNKGETVALVGATGAGKSSIINILSRFYEFQQGEILVDGKSIRSLNQVTLRERMAVVLQDVFLFSRSVEENITLERDNISKEDVIQAAKSLGAHEFISKLPQGYNTNVRERGAVLSVGQKQLISFCRALVTDPDILILDEATSSIDTETEQLIERSISTMLQGRTSIVIAHRLSTIQRADRIIVMHHGEIAEQGTHQELLAHNGVYAKLHELQFAHSTN